MSTDRVELRGLTIAAGDRPLVRGVDLTLQAGRCTALVGASGSGKSLTARSLLGMVDLEPGVIQGALVLSVDGQSREPYAQCLRGSRRARDRAFAGIRGNHLGYLPQDSRAALNPLWTVQRHLAASHHPSTRETCAEWLGRAGFSEPNEVLALYPHQLSGGMAQRVVVAQSLAHGSRFLVADEPTTGLDPTIRMALVQELARLVREGLGLLFITHDLRLLPHIADEVLLMDEGRIVEQMAPEELRTGTPRTDSGRRLLAATRRVAGGTLS